MHHYTRRPAALKRPVRRPTTHPIPPCQASVSGAKRGVERTADPLVLAAIIGAVSAIGAAVVNALGQIAVTLITAALGS